MVKKKFLQEYVSSFADYGLGIRPKWLWIKCNPKQREQILRVGALSAHQSHQIRVLSELLQVLNIEYVNSETFAQFTKPEMMLSHG